MSNLSNGSTANWINLEKCPLKSRFSRPILFGDDEVIIGINNIFLSNFKYNELIPIKCEPI